VIRMDEAPLVTNVHIVPGSVAVTVAVRRPSPMIAISPKKSPGSSFRIS